MAKAVDLLPPDEDAGAFTSFLRYIDRPGQVVRNLLKGNAGGAARQAIDMLGDSVDAVLPGDWIPHLAKREDDVSGADLISVDKEAHPILGFLADVGVGTLTDPLTYVPGGLALKGLKGAAGAASKAGLGAIEKVGGTAAKDAVLNGASKAAVATKETLGWLKPKDPKVAQLVSDADNLANLHTKAGGEEIRRVMGGLSGDEDRYVQEIINGVYRDGDVARVIPGVPMRQVKRVKDGATITGDVVGRRAGDIESIDQQLLDLKQRATQHPGFQQLDEAAQGRVMGGVEGAIRLGHQQFTADVKHGALAHPVQYTDPSGARFHKDELEEMYRQERRIADGLKRKDASLAEDVHDLDVQTNLANKLANQKAGQVGRRIETTGRPTLNQAVDRTPLPGVNAKDGASDQLDPFFPRLFDEIRTDAGEIVPRKEITQVVDQAGDAVWDRSKRRAFGTEVGPTTQLRGELRSQARRDQKLLGQQDDIADELERIDPGDFDAFVAGRGLAPQPVDITAASPRDYLMRRFEDLGDEPLVKTKGSPLPAPSPTKSRTIRTPEELAAARNAPDAAGFEESALKSLGARNDAQGRMLKQATIAKGTLGEKFTSLVDPAADQSARGAMIDAINAMDKTDPEGARLLLNAFQGPGARGPVMETLAKANRLFKPAAVYGVVIPKVGSIVRNAIGGVWQTMSVQGGKAALAQAKRTPEALLGAFDEAIVKGFGLQRLPKGALSADLRTVDDAFRAAKGDGDAVAGILAAGGREDLAQAVQHGVLDGFVSSERIIDDLARAQSSKKKWWDLYDMPGVAFQGVESRMRLGNFLDQLKRGVPAQQASQQVRDTFLDYTVSSGKNRTLRDLIPFAAFTAGSVKQQAKFLGGNPAAAVGLSQALLAADDRESAVMPYQEGRLNIPIGQDAQGHDQYISGIGLPFEVLNSIPNPSANLLDFGRQVERSVVGQAHPLLKSAFGVVTGEDPNFGTDYGSYSKLPGNVEAGDLGRAYNKLAGTGMIQPLDTTVRTAGAIFDDRRGAGIKAVDLLTGANVVSVDPEVARRKQILEWLATHPDVGQHRSFYSRSHDPEVQEMIRASQKR